VAYKDDKGSLPYALIRAHLWLHYKLDFSEEQLKEKMRSSRNYFVHTIMKSDPGLEGTSTYPHFDSMLELYPVHKTEQIIQNRKLIKNKNAVKKGIYPLLSHMVLIMVAFFFCGFLMLFVHCRLLG